MSAVLGVQIAPPQHAAVRGFTSQKPGVGRTRLPWFGPWVWWECDGVPGGNVINEPLESYRMDDL